MHKKIIPPLHRREFLKLAHVTTGIAALEQVDAAQQTRASAGLIDVNVHLSRWPARRLPCDDASTLVARLRRHGVVEAWAGSFDAILHKDIAAVNAGVAGECRRHGRGLLVPIGSINPKLPDWEENLRRCAEEHRMPGIRLYPNYHGYNMDDPDFARLLRLATDWRLIVQLAVAMEDERMIHPLLRVKPVDTSALAALVKQTPGLRLLLLNALGRLRGPALMELINAGQLYVEIATLEGVGGVANLIAQVPVERVLFGSHAPFFYFESSLLKLKESPLTQEQLRTIQHESAHRLLTKAG